MKATAIATSLMLISFLQFGKSSLRGPTILYIPKINKEMTIILQKHSSAGDCASSRGTPVKDLPYVVEWKTKWFLNERNFNNTWYIDEDSDFVTKTGVKNGMKMTALKRNSVVKLTLTRNSTILHRACGYIEGQGVPDANEIATLNTFCRDPTLINVNQTNCN